MKSLSLIECEYQTRTHSLALLPDPDCGLSTILKVVQDQAVVVPDLEGGVFTPIVDVVMTGFSIAGVRLMISRSMLVWDHPPEKKTLITWWLVILAPVGQVGRKLAEWDISPESTRQRWNQPTTTRSSRKGDIT